MPSILPNSDRREAERARGARRLRIAVICIVTAIASLSVVDHSMGDDRYRAIIALLIQLLLDTVRVLIAS